MLLVPYRTHAYRTGDPVGTVALIVLNSLAFLACWVGVLNTEDWVLHYGDFSPLQWLSSAFMHADLVHLIGNMVFLWAFGQIVEGVAKTPRFLVLYLAIVLVSGALEQVCFMDSQGASLGASGVIYGLLGAAVICAPKTEIETFSWVLLRVHFATFSVGTMGFIYALLQMLYAGVAGFSLSSALLHLLGFGVGLGLGTLCVFAEWIDGGGWDWFSLYAGRRGSKRT